MNEPVLIMLEGQMLFVDNSWYGSVVPELVLDSELFNIFLSTTSSLPCWSKSQYL